MKILKEKYLLNFKKNKKKIVLCHGVFDLLHPGHIHHFNEAKKLGDILIVSLTADKFVSKGLRKPFFNQDLRLKSILSLKCVDYVLVSNYHTAENVIKKIKPHFYCKGQDYKKQSDDLSGNIKKEIKLVKKYGGQTIFTSGITFSSSQIIRNNFDTLDKKQKNEIIYLKKKFNIENIKKILKKLQIYLNREIMKIH